MIAFLLAYAATAYLFSGSLCYLTSFNHRDSDSQHLQLKCNSSKLASLWIAFFWPLWIVKQSKAEDREPQTVLDGLKLRKY